VEEILGLVEQEMSRVVSRDKIASGVVITGGSALLPGMAEIADQIFQVPTRIGYPQNLTGLVDMVNTPMYSTAIGLVLHGLEYSVDKKFRIRDGNIFNRLLAKMKSWFKF